MKSKPICLIVVLFTALLLFSIMGITAIEQIRPAPQTESRGVDEQIRPINQQGLPSDGNGNYHPAEGSGYSSSVYTPPPVVSDRVKMKAVLNSNLTNTTSNATGTGNFVVNKTSNTLSYNITYNGLSSNETLSDMSVPGLVVNNQSVSFPLPSGEIKQGVINYIQNIESYLLEGKLLVKIRSLLFPNGEISGELKII